MAATGNDRLFGVGGNDEMHGEDGNDLIYGGLGNDQISAGNGNDNVVGDQGADVISAGNGIDRLNGGAGADQFHLWDDDAQADTLVFAAGDSGLTVGTIDYVEGFQSGQDKIDLRAFGHMVYTSLNFTGGGTASAYYDGDYLRIDGDGNGVTDMMVQFAWTDNLTSGDFLLA